MNESSMAANLLPDRLDEVRTRIASAALRCNRSPDSVALIAIAKGQPARAVRLLAGAGQRDFGENYLQEALPKMAELAGLASPAQGGLVWHFTGQLQGNKTRAVAENFQWVHTVDRARIAARLNEQRPETLPVLDVCIQVRLVEESGKGGVAPDEAAGLAREIAALPRLRLRGLMCIPPHFETHDEQLAVFGELAACRDRLNALGMKLDTLSMGMSADLEAAVAAGATMVRVGTALFGERC